MDLTGQIFTKWTVVGRGPNDKGNRSRWFCRCKCGELVLVKQQSLKSGRSKGCITCGRNSRCNTYEKVLTRIMINKNRCWIWTGNKSKDGYGKVRFHNKDYRTHRFFFIYYKGNIPKDRQLDHLCRNRACCNPDHLEIVTSKENTLRGNTFQAANLIKTHCPKGHPYNKENTYVYFQKNGVKARHCIICRRLNSQIRYQNKKYNA